MVKIEPYGFAIIGCGFIGQKHARVLSELEGAEITAVCDNVKDRAVEFGKKYKAKPYTDYAKLLKNKDVDIVTLCTPSGMHAQMTIDAAKAGKHVVTEKPMALTLRGADKMMEECKKNNVRLFVIKQNRYNPPIKRLKEAIDKGRFGKIFLANTTIRWSRPQKYYNGDEWRGTLRMDGGVIMNQASHHIDLLRWLIGEVDSVFAKIGTLTHDIEVDDTAAVVLRFKNGALGVIEATTGIFPKNLEGSVAVFGTKGSAKVGGSCVSKMDVWDFQDYENEDDEIMKFSTLPPDVYAYSHREVFKNIIGALKTNKDPLISGIEGRKTLELIQAIYKSARTSKEIKLPLTEE